jgi:hypothetical protein
VGQAERGKRSSNKLGRAVLLTPPALGTPKALEIPMATVSDPRNPIKTRQATLPATGVCRWLTRPNAEHAGGVLSINSTVYEVLPLYDGEALVGYRLLKAGTATMYDVGTTAPHGWTCDCPDATFNPDRPGGCKHASALRAALAALKGGAA